MINGVVLSPKKQIPDARGAVKLFVDGDNEFFVSCYTTTVYKGIIKGWHGYWSKTLNYVVPIGLVKLVLFDDRTSSPTVGQIDEYYLGEMNYQRITIPPGVLNAFQGIADPLSLAVVVADEPFDEHRTRRLPIDTESIPYDWSKINR